MIVAQRLSKSFRKGSGAERFVFQDLDLEIAKSALALIRGASGSGKSTLLGLLGVMDFPTSGRVRVLGTWTSECSDADLVTLRRKVGFVFQEPHFFSAISVRRNVEMPLIPLGMSSLEQQESVQAALDRLGIAGLERMLPGQLSGGERQKVAIARALVARPEILIADEPTSQLDEGGAESIARLFQDLRQSGLTVVVASHDPIFVQFATAMGWWSGGRLVYSDVKC